MILTDEGRNVATYPDSPMTLDDLQAGFMAIITRPQRDILEVLIAEYPRGLSKTELADRTGYAESGGAFGNYLGRMRSMGIIDYPQKGMVSATNVLFPEGLV